MVIVKKELRIGIESVATETCPALKAKFMKKKHHIVNGHKIIFFEENSYQKLAVEDWA